VRYEAWAPHYARLRDALGYPFAREEASARRLVEHLPPEAREDPLGRLGARLRGRDVVVAGLAPGAGPPPVWRLPRSAPSAAIVAADGAAAACLAAGLVPDVITTDLDGPVPAEIEANLRGSLVVVHAHGDNAPAIDEWVPQFPGALAGSWAGPPRDGLLDVGGFTDGDRAAYLADELGAHQILLWGFDFETTDATDPAERARKLAKLAWARTVLALLAREGTSPLYLWQRDGRRVPYPAGIAAESTR